MPVMPVWVDQTPWFTSRPTSRKAKNLAHNAHCVITVGGEDLDLVVEGKTNQAHDETQLRRVVDAFKAKYQWEFSVRDGRAYDDSPGVRLLSTHPHAGIRLRPGRSDRDTLAVQLVDRHLGPRTQRVGRQ
jgi:hypothetical protein